VSQVYLKVNPELLATRALLELPGGLVLVLLRPALSFAVGLPELKLRFNYGVVNTVIKAKL